MRGKIILAAALYIGVALLDAGFINADFRTEFPSLCAGQRWARQNLAFSIGWALFPPAPILTPFVTGFYQSGWTLSGAPCQVGG